MACISFDELASLTTLRTFYDLLFRLFGVKIHLISIDNQHDITLGSQEEDPEFCRLIHLRQHGCACCQTSDRVHLQQALASGNTLRYYCHAGLTEFVIPVTHDGDIIAFIRCGQILDTPPTPDSWEEMCARLCQAQIDPAPLHTAYFALPVVAPDRQKDLMLLLALISNYIADAHRLLLQTKEPRSSQIIERAQSYLKQQYITDISLDDVAQEVCVSRRTLSRLFRAELGMTVLDYLTRIRVQEASRLLRSTTKSCEEIARETGFSNGQQFSRVFKQAFHIAPAQWRKQLNHADGVQLSTDTQF